MREGRKLFVDYDHRTRGSVMTGDQREEIGEMDFITIEIEERVISPMPADETVVEVKLKDGTTCLAWFSANIMEAGDWDFVPLEPGTDEPDMMADSIADEVVAWRKLSGDRT